jgi:SAM-dependent methyltransferase
MPTDEALKTLYGEYYSGGYWSNSKPHESFGEKEKITFDRPLRLARHIRSGITSSFAGRRVDILDFGGGDGTVSSMLGKSLLDTTACQEVRVVLIDSGGHVPHTDDTRLSITSRNRPENGGQQYDIVIASAVLEHIPYPAEVLRSLLGSLRTRGVFYARTPYSVPLLHRLPFPRIRTRLFTFPFHVHDMGQDFWENILGELKLARDFRMLQSRPSIVEGTFGKHFTRALAGYILKAPWYVLGRRYGIVGGWEVFIQKADA